MAGDLAVLYGRLSSLRPRLYVVAVPVVPCERRTVALHLQLTYAFVSPENGEFLNMRELPLVVF